MLRDDVTHAAVRTIMQDWLHVVDIEAELTRQHLEPQQLVRLHVTRVLHGDVQVHVIAVARAVLQQARALVVDQDEVVVRVHQLAVLCSSTRRTNNDQMTFLFKYIYKRTCGANHRVRTHTHSTMYIHKLCMNMYTYMYMYVHTCTCMLVE